MLQTKSILVGAIPFILLCLLMYTCNEGKKKDIIKSTSEIVFVTDTLFYSSVDTVYKSSDVKYVYRDRYIEKINNDSIVDIIHDYNTEDLSATVTTSFYNSKVLSQSLEYSIVYPEITKTDSVIVTNTETVTVTNYIKDDRMNFYLGSSATMSSGSFDGIGVNATLQLKNKVQLGYEYGVNFKTQDEHRVVVKFPLRR